MIISNLKMILKITLYLGRQKEEFFFFFQKTKMVGENRIQMTNKSERYIYPPYRFLILFS
jgi:hypothetical protein